MMIYRCRLRPGSAAALKILLVVLVVLGIVWLYKFRSPFQFAPALLPQGADDGGEAVDGEVCLVSLDTPWCPTGRGTAAAMTSL